MEEELNKWEQEANRIINVARGFGKTPPTLEEVQQNEKDLGVAFFNISQIEMKDPSLYDRAEAILNQLDKAGKEHKKRIADFQRLANVEMSVNNIENKIIELNNTPDTKENIKDVLEETRKLLSTLRNAPFSRGINIKEASPFVSRLEAAETELSVLYEKAGSEQHPQQLVNNPDKSSQSTQGKETPNQAELQPQQPVNNPEKSSQTTLRQEIPNQAEQPQSTGETSEKDTEDKKKKTRTTLRRKTFKETNLKISGIALQRSAMRDIKKELKKYCKEQGISEEKQNAVISKISTMSVNISLIKQNRTRKLKDKQDIEKKFKETKDPSERAKLKQEHDKIMEELTNLTQNIYDKYKEIADVIRTDLRPIRVSVTQTSIGSKTQEKQSDKTLQEKAAKPKNIPPTTEIKTEPPTNAEKIAKSETSTQKNQTVNTQQVEAPSTQSATEPSPEVQNTENETPKQAYERVTSRKAEIDNQRNALAQQYASLLNQRNLIRDRYIKKIAEATKKGNRETAKNLLDLEGQSLARIDSQIAEINGRFKPLNAEYDQLRDAEARIPYRPELITETETAKTSSETPHEVEPDSEEPSPETLEEITLGDEKKVEQQQNTTPIEEPQPITSQLEDSTITPRPVARYNDTPISDFFPEPEVSESGEVPKIGQGYDNEKKKNIFRKIAEAIAAFAKRIRESIQRRLRIAAPGEESQKQGTEPEAQSTEIDQEAQSTDIEQVDEISEFEESLAAPEESIEKMKKVAKRNITGGTRGRSIDKARKQLEK